MPKFKAWCGKLLSLAALVCLVLGGPHLSHAADAGAVFTPGPPMQVARDLFAMATLPGGKVAVFSGEGYGSGTRPNYEIWDPASNQFTLYSMNPHWFPGFVKLPNGDYLVASGYNASAETYHPATNSFAATSDMVYGRCYSNGAILTSGHASGKVLLVGGDYLTAATYGELFNPTARSFAATQTLNTPRAMCLVLPCNDGSAVVMGGHKYNDTSIEYERVELYDPVSNSFSILQEQLFTGDPGWTIVGYTWGQGVYSIKSLDTQRLQDGRYLLLAKKMGFNTYTLFTFDPATKAIAKFTTTPDLPSSFQMSYCPVVDAARGKAYLLSTDSPSGAFVNVRLYTVDLASSRRNSPAGTFPLTVTALNQFGVTLLADGRLLLAGGVEIVDSNWQSVNKTWFINPNRGPVGSMSLLLLD